MPITTESNIMSSERISLFERCNHRLTTDSPESSVATYESFASLVSRAILRDTGEDVGDAIFSLSDCETIDPGALLLMMGAGSVLAQHGWQPKVTGEGEIFALVVRHLNHFLQNSSLPVDAEDTENYLLREIASPDSMVTELGKWSELVQRGTSASPMDVASWEYQIGEVAANGFQHGLQNQGLFGGMEGVWIAGKSATDEVQLAALSHGRSIPTTIARVADQHRIPQDEGRRIELACQKGVTSRSVPENQGAGLWNLSEAVKQNGGKMLILSGSGMLFAEGGTQKTQTLPQKIPTLPVLAGTLTVVNLKI